MTHLLYAAALAARAKATPRRTLATPPAPPAAAAVLDTSDVVVISAQTIAPTAPPGPLVISTRALNPPSAGPVDAFAAALAAEQPELAGALMGEDLVLENHRRQWWSRTLIAVRCRAAGHPVPGKHWTAQGLAAGVPGEGAHA